MKNDVFQSNEDNELNQSIQLYEEGKRNNRLPYLDVDQVCDIAMKYLDDKRYDDAFEVLQYGLHLHRDNADLKLRLGYYYLEIAEYTKAQEVVEQITDICSDEFRLLKAEIYLNKGLLDMAIQETDSIFNKNNLETIINTIYLYLDMGYPDEAKKWLRASEYLYKDNDDFLEAKAGYHCAIEEWEKAIELYDKLLDRHPFNSIFWVAQAKCYINLNNPQKMLDACDFAIAADEACGEAYLLRGHAYLLNNQLEQARKDYEKAIQYHAVPYSIGMACIGNIYLDQDDLEKAYKTYTKVLEYLITLPQFSPNHPDASFASEVLGVRGYISFQLGQPEKAMEDVRKAILYNPYNWEAYYLKASIFLNEDRPNEAFDVLKTLYHELYEDPKSPSDFHIWFQMGKDYQLQKRFDIASKCYQQARILDPNHEETIKRLLLTYVKLDDNDKYLELIDQYPSIKVEDFIRFLLDEDDSLNDKIRETFQQILKDKEQNSTNKD